MQPDSILKRGSTERSCLYCQRSFVALNSWLRKGFGKYCSVVCTRNAVRIPATERFWRHVDRKADEGCWIWTARTRGGYGQFTIDGRIVGAHVFSWELHNGRPVTPGLLILHTCPGGDNRGCVNPSHLREGTHLDNSHDAKERGRLATGLRSGPYTKPHRVARGERNRHAKLTEVQVAEIRRRYAVGGITQQALADEFGVGDSMVCQIISGKSWHHTWIEGALKGAQR